MRRAWRTLTSHARYTVGCDWRPSPSPYRRRSVPLALAGPGVSPGHLPLERAGQAACGAEAKRASINRCLEQQEGKKKKQDGHLPSAWPGPAAVSLLPIAPLSSGRPPLLRLLTDLKSSLSSSSLFALCPVSGLLARGDILPSFARGGPNAAAIDEPSSCQQLQVSPATAPAPQLGAHCEQACRSCLPSEKEHGTWYLYVQTCRRAIWGGAGRPTQGLGLDKGPRGVPARRGWISVAPGFVRWGQGEVVMDDGP